MSNTRESKRARADWKTKNVQYPPDLVKKMEDIARAEGSNFAVLVRRWCIEKVNEANNERSD